ncbi:MAG: glucose-6-phosphate dehydrogenase assembly protein OpcA, partial [Candidatus Eremiobacteraeota bacterium]|nr:glucose-6-phosphate dehydrogenase assembly protein OpcA [Candidatus Eremiobacteraeota bacterium]
PARVMILDATRKSSADVESCTRPFAEGTTINAERIELGVGGLPAQIVSSGINALRIGDIPDVLWWTSSKLDEHDLFDQMLPLVDVLIVDSSGLDAAPDALCGVAAFAQRSHAILLRDLAYMRLSPWQDMVAQFFDDERFLGDLADIEQIEIASGSDAEAFYLVGWLASRLKWRPCARNVLCDSAGRKIELKFKRKGNMRRVLRVALSTAQRTFAADLSESEDTVCLSISDQKRKRCMPLHHIDNLSLLERAFLFNSKDDVFESSLRVLCDLFNYEA